MYLSKTLFVIETTTYLLVDDDEALVGAVAHLVLEIDDLLHSVHDVLALRKHQPLALGGRLVEDARVHLAETPHSDVQEYVCCKSETSNRRLTFSRIRATR